MSSFLAIVAHTIAMRFFLLVTAALGFAQSPTGQHDNYYSVNRDSQVGERLATQIQANIVAVPETRLDRLGGPLTALNPEFKYRFFVFDGGQPSTDTAPAAAFPADWRRLDLDEAIAIAGGMVFVPRRLLSRDDAQLSVILAHAIGHIALRHPTVGMTRGELAQVEVQAASRAIPEEAAQRVRAVALNRFAFDRECESAADGYAVRLLHQAGLDPASLLAYLRALPPQNGEMSVYPPPAERLEAAQKAIGTLRR
jgi:Zn-dependent protease with chaperone function